MQATVNPLDQPAINEGSPVRGPVGVTNEQWMTGKLSLSRMPQLDFLRGVAILLVVGSHVHTKLHTNPLDMAPFLPLMYAGWSGVPLFFVLSGFLVSGLLYSEVKKAGKIDMTRFLIRRAFKIYPGYYVYLLACALLCLTLGWNAQPMAFLHQIFFLQNYFPSHSLGPHTWSLAVEEHFYIALAVALVVLYRATKSLKAIPYVCLATMVLSFVFRAAAAVSGQYLDHPTHMRVDSLAFGVLLAYLYHFHSDRLKKIAKAKWAALLTTGLIIAGVGIRPEFHWFGYVFGLSFCYLGYGSLLLLCIYSNWQQNWIRRSISRVGVYSYSIYLWHLLVWWAVMVVLGHYAPQLPLILSAPIYVFLSVSIGIAMAKVIEFPLLRLRDYCFPSKVAAPAQVAMPMTGELQLS